MKMLKPENLIKMQKIKVVKKVAKKVAKKK